jgi:IS1 family transposase
MNVLSRDQQIQIIAALTEGMSIRATERLTGVHRDTIMRLGVRMGVGCAELHDRQMVGIRAGRIELDELWAFVGKKQKRTTPEDAATKGDAYTFIALASSAKAIISYRTGKRDTGNTADFIFDLRERVLGSPELSSDGFASYQPAIRDAFGADAAYGQIVKTYSVVDLRPAASVRYSPADVVQVERRAVSGDPAHISTSYVERSHLSLRMTNRRFGRLTNAFSKTLTNHAASVSLYVAYYNFCRVHEALRATPAMALGIADRVWSIGDLLDAALSMSKPADGRRLQKPRLRVIDGGKSV